jgi:hypothetical protein
MDDYLVSVGCCHVEVFATSRSIVQGNPTECCMSEIDVKPQQKGGSGTLETVVT